MDKLRDSTTDHEPPADTSEDDERAKKRKAQDVMARASTDVRQVCLVILTVLAVLYTLFFAAAIILPFVLALVLTLVLGPAMRLLNRQLRIPNMVAALMLIVVLFSVIGALGFAVSVPASSWIAKAPQSLPVLLEKLSFLREPIRLVQHGVQQVQNLMTQSGESGEQQTGGSDQSANTGRDSRKTEEQPGGSKPQTVMMQQSSRYGRYPGDWLIDPARWTGFPGSGLHFDASAVLLPVVERQPAAPICRDSAKIRRQAPCSVDCD